MVKIHDGSLVPASELLSNNAEDDEGEKLKFEQVKDAAYPTFEAKSKVHDDSGRERTYRFSFDDTNVTVHMIVSEEKSAKGKDGADVKGQHQSSTGTSVKEVHASSTGANADSKKNSSTNEQQQQQQQKLNPPDYRLRRSPA